MGVFFKKIGWAASLFGMLGLVNGQWALLQAVAWTGMMVSYSADSGLEQGIAQTFDGSRPCSLCEMVEEAVADSESEDEIASSSPTERLLAVPAGFYSSVSKIEENRLFNLHDASIGSRSCDRPPTPPPRISPV